MTTQFARVIVAAMIVSAIGCASPPPPRTLADVDALASSPRGAESKSLAPQAYLHAQQLATQARAAHNDGDTELASLLSEQALAQLEQAVALARASKAQSRKTSASAKLDEGKIALSAIDLQQAELTAQTEALELRTRVIRDALSPVPSGKTTAEREQARREASRALLTDARLLCVAAQLLKAEPEATRKQLEAVAVLEREVEQAGRTAPIDASFRARASCLALLSSIRQIQDAKSVEAGASVAIPVDLLLDELSRGGYQPQRDDRGIIVVLRDGFQGNGLSAQGQQRLSELTRVAKAHPQFPLLLVLHSARGRSTAADSERLAAAKSSLVSAGLQSTRGELAGSSQPLVPPNSPQATAENARLEIIFVAPTW